MSAGSPTSSRPTYGSPSARAGTADAALERILERARRARAGSEPRSIIVSTLPASIPSGARTAPSCTSSSTLPRLYAPPLPLAAATASVTSATRPAAARQTSDGGRGSEMDPVEDDLDEDVVAHERGADDPGLAVIERPHRVEEMRDHARAAVERRGRLLRRRVAVPARDGDAARDEVVDQLERAGQLRRQRHHPHRPRGEQPLEQRSVGIAPAVRRMRAEPPRREERPLEVHAEDARARPDHAGTSASAASKSVLRRRDQRRQERRHARLEQRLAGLAVTVAVRLEEVDAAETVHLHVDEAGHRDAAAVRAAQPDARDAAVDDLDVAGNETPADERGFDTEPHPTSASRTLPPAAASRARAASASTSGEKRDDRNLRLAARRGEGARRRLRRKRRSPRRRFAARAREASRSPATTSTIRPAYVLPSLIIVDRRERVEDELLSGARLQSRRARENLRADDGADRRVAELRELRRRAPTRRSAVNAPAVPAAPRRAEHERRASAGAHQHDRVVPR